MNRFGRLWDYLRSSFWFVPSLMVTGSVVLAFALIEMDSTGGDEWLAQWPRLFGNTVKPPDARWGPTAGLV